MARNFAYTAWECVQRGNADVDLTSFYPIVYSLRLKLKIYSVRFFK